MALDMELGSSLDERPVGRRSSLALQCRGLKAMQVRQGSGDGERMTCCGITGKSEIKI